MSINFGWKRVDGFDKELLLYGEGYIGKPVTLDANSGGIITTDEGRKIIPQGSYLFGTSNSLITNPQQMAKVVSPSSTKATVTIGTKLVITAKAEGAVAIEVELKKGTTKGISVDATASKVTVTLGVNKNDNIVSTYGDVVKTINDNMDANTLIIASLASEADADVVAVEGTGTTASGGATTVSSDIDGVLLHSIDVTDGEATGAMMIAGYINMDNMPEVPGEAVMAKLPNIHFGRID